MNLQQQITEIIKDSEGLKAKHPQMSGLTFSLKDVSYSELLAISNNHKTNVEFNKTPICEEGQEVAKTFVPIGGGIYIFLHSKPVEIERTFNVVTKNV